MGVGGVGVGGVDVGGVDVGGVDVGGVGVGSDRGGGGGREWCDHAANRRRDDMARPQLSLTHTTFHWTGTGLRKVAGSPVGVQWTGLDWTPVDWAFCQPIWPGKRATGIHWSPVESSGVHMDYVGDGKDLLTSAHQASMFDFQHVGTSTNVPPVSPSSAHQPSIFDFQKPGRSPPALARQASIFDFQQVGTSTNVPPVPPSSARQASIFDFQKPDIPAPASARQASIFDFQQVDTSTNVPPVPPSSARQPSIFDFQKPNNPAPASANKGSPFDFQVHRSFTPASAVQPSIDFQTPGTSAPAPASDKPGMSSPGASRSNSTLGSRKYLTKSQEAKLRLQGQGGAAILPTQPGDAFVFGLAPVFVYTQERTTPRPPPSTELLDLDPNSPRARGLCRKYNIKVVSDDSIGDRTGVVAEVVQAIGKVWERAMDPEASSDPSIRNLQAAFDKLLTRGDEFTEMDRMDLVRHSEIHQEALRSLPDSIATTSHYRYVLATLRREKDRLREQIDSDRDLVAAMDVEDTRCQIVLTFNWS
ncbi:uncharacterized protein LACBIDRAFT_304737 [Laccaria bicolor S238N-H82]|uniref:Predicted protein n=1 Tax=Laccaria bicolor (strain S238N-H82 / ATCC MYA-4686) TaxID=486041 RepID=B0DM74_LACBS|nr:uncharacterized protein LACBIDRAFT_304737 [Laccaria bicolor S238N-H82]EDR04232.1 predicted protein [Laccaria bicolor S238N-H82]|eukprot:XP_001885123.1 predicted protein [Laccaria bicolor S238N-H82]